MENNQLIAKAVQYAKSNATSTEINVRDIACNAGFSMDYFNRIFLSHTGFTVMAYVNYIRMKKATELIRNTDKSLLEIALAVGYDSHEGFLKAFKKQYGVTPKEYKIKMQNKVLTWGELADRSLAAQFIYANPDFRLVDAGEVIDLLLEKNAKEYGYFCTTIKYMGLAIAAPGGDLDKGIIGIGDNRQGGYYLELLTDDFDRLAEWLNRFSCVDCFYSACDSAQTKKALTKRGVTKELAATPQSFYFGPPLSCDLSQGLVIRPLTPCDRNAVLQWADGNRDGYIQHLLNETHYKDESVLEYGVFEGEKLIAVAGCGIDEVHGFRLNNCCAIRFARGRETDALYRTIFAYVVNDVMEKGLLPFDDIQHGEYAKAHGNFTAVDLGFRVVNWRYRTL